jgi:4'-phosphopantetheinyl transferase
MREMIIHKTDTGFLYPVILKVPETIRALKGKNKVAALSLFARESAKASGLESKLYVDRFNKDGQGVPKPSNGVYWSVSHKLDFVAGVVSTKKIGIDLEQIKEVSGSLFKRIVDSDEESYFRHQEKSIVFFRAFTAKEAVLKKTTIGMQGLSKVKIINIIDDKNLVAQYADKKYLVENFYFGGYLASVTKDNLDVQWTIR